jgi:hypothetical protein
LSKSSSECGGPRAHRGYDVRGHPLMFRGGYDEVDQTPLALRSPSTSAGSPTSLNTSSSPASPSSSCFGEVDAGYRRRSDSDGRCGDGLSPKSSGLPPPRGKSEDGQRMHLPAVVVRGSSLPPVSGSTPRPSLELSRAVAPAINEGDRTPDGTVRKLGRPVSRSGDGFGALSLGDTTRVGGPECKRNPNGSGWQLSLCRNVAMRCHPALPTKDTFAQRKIPRPVTPVRDGAAATESMAPHLSPSSSAANLRHPSKTGQPMHAADAEAIAAGGREASGGVGVM